MRQVVVLEPAGSVLVIRSAASGATAVPCSNALEVVNAATNVVADHNHNRIVVVRSSSLPLPTLPALPPPPPTKIHSVSKAISAPAANCSSSGNSAACPTVRAMFLLLVDRTTQAALVHYYASSGMCWSETLDVVRCFAY